MTNFESPFVVVVAKVGGGFAITELNQVEEGETIASIATHDWEFIRECKKALDLVMDNTVLVLNEGNPVLFTIKELPIAGDSPEFHVKHDDTPVKTEDDTYPHTIQTHRAIRCDECPYGPSGSPNCAFRDECPPGYTPDEWIG